MKINNNISISSSNRFKENISENKDNQSKNNNFKNENVSNNIKPFNLKINLKKSSPIEGIKYNHFQKTKNLIQYQNDKKSEREELNNELVSINSNILIKSDKNKEKSNINNNSEIMISYKRYDNNNVSFDIENNREENKIQKKKELYKAYIKNRQNDELENILYFKLNKNKKDKNNEIITKNFKLKFKKGDNINNINEKKVNYIIETTNLNEQIRDKINNDSNDSKNTQEKYFKCLFCDKISDNKEYISLFRCNHFFCKKCGKKFYEEIIEIMIENNNINFIHCPIIDCPKEVSLSLIKKIVSKHHYNELDKKTKIIKNKDNVENMINHRKPKKDKLGKIEKIEDNKNNENKDNKEKNQIYNMNTEMFDKKERNLFYKNKYIKEYNKYLQKNIIDLNSNKKYIYFIQKSFSRCPFCQEYSLYGGIEGNFDKCLKCLKKFCKYCHKGFEDSHLDITKINHCKVFYRTYKDFIQSKFYYRFFTNLLYVIAGYLFVITFFIIKIKRALKIRNISIKLMRIFLYFILFLLFLPMIIIIFPYFPIIISI